MNPLPYFTIDTWKLAGQKEIENVSITYNPVLHALGRILKKRLNLNLHLQ